MGFFHQTKTIHPDLARKVCRGLKPRLINYKAMSGLIIRCLAVDNSQFAF